MRYLLHTHDWLRMRSRANRELRYAALLYAIGLSVHTADHFRRGTDVITPQVYWAGLLSTFVAVIAIGFVLLEVRPAPVVAVGVGLTNAIGVAAVHLLPSWSAFSDAFPGSMVDSLSWTAVLVEIASAVVFGVAGKYALGTLSGASWRPVR